MIFKIEIGNLILIYCYNIHQYITFRLVRNEVDLKLYFLQNINKLFRIIIFTNYRILFSNEGH